ncbi:MAG TPA: hypothetical protein VKB18_03575 [Gemmatimonadota bacterium]|nr:hypothetical protein [Gemmatimonadota bacterium]
MPHPSEAPAGVGREGGADAGEGAGSGAREEPGRIACTSCRELYPHSDLDRQLWCPGCRDELSRKVRWGRHLAALLVTVPFAIWIAVEGRFGVLPLYAWLIPLAAAYYLGYRIGREVMKGYVRTQRGEPADD